MPWTGAGHGPVPSAGDAAGDAPRTCTGWLSSSAGVGAAAVAAGFGESRYVVGRRGGPGSGFGLDPGLGFAFVPRGLLDADDAARAGFGFARARLAERCGAMRLRLGWGGSACFEVVLGVAARCATRALVSGCATGAAACVRCGAGLAGRTAACG
ncbi:MAG TPA: hypothetical protein VFA44_12770 [Gaiellaceae bacterium]|nr:hypothetical protein [Gaiellaceae bacterium]